MVKRRFSDLKFWKQTLKSAKMTKQGEKRIYKVYNRHFREILFKNGIV